jgi:hypothetical protein
MRHRRCDQGKPAEIGRGADLSGCGGEHDFRNWPNAEATADDGRGGFQGWSRRGAVAPHGIRQFAIRKVPPSGPGLGEVREPRIGIEKNPYR